jgi:hypothetical protein
MMRREVMTVMAVDPQRFVACGHPPLRGVAGMTVITMATGNQDMRGKIK